MSWRDELRRVTLPDGRRLVGASFRGVPFFVQSADRTGGRRIVTHEFPLRDDNFVDDLGRRARVFRVDGYLLGQDYFTQRDALLAACEDESGPGQLVHPFYGVKRCVAGSLSVRETMADGGMAVVSIEFNEAPVQGVAPTADGDLADQASTSAGAASTAAKAELEASFDVAGLASFALKSASTALRNATEALNAKLAPLVTTTQELADFNGQVNVLTAEASSLVTQPGQVFDRFTATITTLADTAASAPGEVVAALIDAYGADLGDDAPETTVTRQRERANQKALQAALRQIVIIQAARLAPTTAYDSIDQATAVRDQIMARLDELAAGAGDIAYPALVDLRAAVARAVPDDTLSARVITVERRTATPSLLLAYQLYGSVGKESDLIARNDTINPAFMLGSIKALSDA